MVSNLSLLGWAPRIWKLVVVGARQHRHDVGIHVHVLAHLVLGRGGLQHADVAYASLPAVLQAPVKLVGKEADRHGLPGRCQP